MKARAPSQRIHELHWRTLLAHNLAAARAARVRRSVAVVVVLALLLGGGTGLLAACLEYLLRGFFP